MTRANMIRNIANPILLLLTFSVFAADVEFPDGTDWQRASEKERLAYITGFSNALSAGYVSDESHLPGNQETFSHRAIAGLSGTSIEQGMNIIDAWYKAHPTQLNIPILQVLWEQAGKPHLVNSQPLAATPERKP